MRFSYKIIIKNLYVLIFLNLYRNKYTSDHIFFYILFLFPLFKNLTFLFWEN